jgi:hypothetical protein
LTREDSVIQLTTIAGPVHGFTRVEVQERVLNLLTEWVAGLPRTTRRAPRGLGGKQENGDRV